MALGRVVRSPGKEDDRAGRARDRRRVCLTSHRTAQAAISATGTLVYALVGDQVPKSSVVVVDINGRAQPLTDALRNHLGEFSLPSDGQRVALRSAKANDDIPVLDIPRGSLTRLTYEDGDNNLCLDARRQALGVQVTTWRHTGDVLEDDRGE